MTLYFNFDRQDLEVFDYDLDLEGQGNMDRQNDTQITIKSANLT